MKSYRVIYHDLECTLSRTVEGCWGYEGKEYWELGITAKNVIDMERCQKLGFEYLDRGIFYLRISDYMAKKTIG